MEEIKKQEMALSAAKYYVNLALYIVEAIVKNVSLSKIKPPDFNGNSIITKETLKELNKTSAKTNFNME